MIKVASFAFYAYTHKKKEKSIALLISLIEYTSNLVKKDKNENELLAQFQGHVQILNKLFIFFYHYSIIQDLI